MMVGFSNEVVQMTKQYKIARKMKNLKLTEAAEKLGVSQPTLSSWESERKPVPVYALERMADLYGVTTDFLLGRECTSLPDLTQSIPHENLPIMHGKPVWSKKYGWLLVDGIEKILLSAENVRYTFSEIDEIYYYPSLYSEAALPLQKPLSRKSLSQFHEIWLEPISSDRVIREQLCGWYRVREHWVENIAGNRFTFDTYGSKWLAFHEK